MRYWQALAFCRDQLVQDEWRAVSLDRFSEALGCTRRNAQLVIKRLVKEQILDWQAGVGRGNLPQAKLLKRVDTRLKRQAEHYLKAGQIEPAISLLPEQERSSFLGDYLAQYQSKPSDSDILQIPFYRATHGLDPISISRRTEHHIASYLYAKLIHFEHKSAEFRCDLAQLYQLRGDTLTVVLRKHLYFHDGSELTAHSVKAHFERLIGSRSGSRPLFEFIDEVIVDGERQLRFISHQMPRLLPKLLAHTAMGISKESGQKRFGAGPFMLVEQNEWRTLLSVFPRYHGYRPWIDGIEIWNLGANAKEFTLHSDVAHGREVRKYGSEGFVAKRQWEPGCVYAMLNPQRHSWMAVSEHRAWLQGLLSAMLPPSDSEGEVLAKAQGMMGQPDFSPASVEQSHPLLAGLNLSLPQSPLNILTYQLSTHIAVAEQVANQLSSVGIGCNIEVLPFPEFDNEKRLAEADIIISGEVFSDDSDMSWLGWLLCTSSVNACLSTDNKHWLKRQAVEIMKQETAECRLARFESLERELVERGLYQPLYHTQQDLNVSEHIAAPDLLANGWIDFSQVVIMPKPNRGAASQ
ncbi:ABC transporter substrate-binding protein [Vibrio navarrensis]|uniref:ABC transporter substrate-binding protein n=1 Tax=Vibrio navarrensis TaxID=29495 RepID=UPI001869A0FD|nr:ABC transporter substrate-binding protein [Vibrio navarrensis]MBE4618294.1 ABC transporter substrate-binding protein [Vibrio navarrensis]